MKLFTEERFWIAHQIASCVVSNVRYLRKAFFLYVEEYYQPVLKIVRWINVSLIMGSFFEPNLLSMEKYLNPFRSRIFNLGLLKLLTVLFRPQMRTQRCYTGFVLKLGHAHHREVRGVSSDCSQLLIVQS